MHAMVIEKWDWSSSHNGSGRYQSGGAIWLTPKERNKETNLEKTDDMSLFHQY